MSLVYVITKGNSIDDIRYVCIDDSDQAQWLASYCLGRVLTFDTDNNPPMVELFKVYTVKFDTAGTVTGTSYEFVDIIHRDQIIANPIVGNNPNNFIVKVVEDDEQTAIASATTIRQTYLVNLFGLS